MDSLLEKTPKVLPNAQITLIGDPFNKTLQKTSE